MSKLMMMAVAVVAMAAVVSGGVVSADHATEVKVKGAEDFEPNALFKGFPEQRDQKCKSPVSYCLYSTGKMV